MDQSDMDYCYNRLNDAVHAIVAGKLDYAIELIEDVKRELS
jgi:hypothetical protein